MIKKILITIAFLVFDDHAYAQQSLKNSLQLVLVIASDWDSSVGTLRRYERKSFADSWKKITANIPVVLGAKGMAWGIDIENISSKTLRKKEGDQRTPSGIYEIGPGFGFNPKTTGKLDYFPITNSSICIDDPHSVYYNQLVDQDKLPTTDWNSAERMRHIPGYKIGSMLQYNTEHPIAGSGSCIFMHIWKNAQTGTAGCIAMNENALTQTLSWLNSRKTPMMVILVKSEYQRLKSDWQLPRL